MPNHLIINKCIGDIMKGSFNRRFHRVVEGDQEQVDFVTGSNIRMWRNNNDITYSMHWHSALEIVTPITETYTIAISDKVYELVPGEIIVIPPGELHETRSPGIGERYICLFDISNIAKIPSMASILNVFNSPFLISKNTAPEIVRPCIECINRMAEIYYSEGTTWELRMYSELLVFFSIIGDHKLDKIITVPTKIKSKQKEYIEKFNALFAYIDAHFADDLSLEFAAEYTGYSKYHFTRLFKQFSNTTFYDYLCIRRIKIAEELLINPDFSITEVAIRSGFPSIATFNRLFKKIKNCTPSEYRELREKNTFKVLNGTNAESWNQ